MKMRSLIGLAPGLFAREQFRQLGVEILFAQVIFFEHALHVRFVFAVQPAVDDELVGVLVNFAFHLLVLADGVNRDAGAEPADSFTNGVDVVVAETTTSAPLSAASVDSTGRNIEAVFLADFFGVTLARLRCARGDADFF